MALNFWRLRRIAPRLISAQVLWYCLRKVAAKDSSLNRRCPLINRVVWERSIAENS